MTRIVFKAADVLRVVEHTLNATAHAPELVKYDDDFKPITKPGKPGVILVHDQGVYLMSNGEPRDILRGEHSYVAYALGCNPETDGDWWETARALVGGDDFGETLPWAEDIMQQIEAGSDEIAFEFSDDQIALRDDDEVLAGKRAKCQHRDDGRGRCIDCGAIL